MKFFTFKRFSLKGSQTFICYLALLIATIGLSSGIALAGDYDGVNLPSIIPTAYQDAQISVDKDKKQASDAKESTDAGSDQSANQANQTVKESENNLSRNIQVLMQAGNFGTTGLFFGPTSGNSKVDAYGSLTSSVGLDAAGMDQFGANASDASKVQAYHAFGLAMTHLKDAAAQTQPPTIGFERTVGAFEKIATSVSKFGLNLVKQFNPLPVVGAFYDASFLNNSAYTGHANASDDNKLIKIVNSSDILSSIIRTFGEPVGGYGISLSYFMTAVLVFLSFGYAAFIRLFNGQRFGIILRKALVKITIASIILPLVTVQGSKLLSAVDGAFASQNATQEEQIMRNNLNIYNWYKNAAFGLPAGTSISVKNGYFQFTPDIVMAINKYSSTNKTSAPVIEQPPASSIVGDSNDKPAETKPVKDLNNEAIANGLYTAALTNNNTSKVTFSPSYNSGSSSIFGGATPGKPWETSDVTSYSEALGSNKKYDPKEQNIANSPYVTNVGLQATGAGINFTYTQQEAGYGISPLAAFNLMATDFYNDGFVVKTNTSEIKTPTVAINIGTVGVDRGGAVPSIVKLVMIFTVLIAGIKALMSIITAGFGGMFRGAAGTALGSAAGAGTLIGGVLAITLGVVGISVILSIALSAVDMVWTFVTEVFNSVGIKDSLDDFSSSILGSIKSWPLIGSLLDDALKSLSTFVLTIVAILMMPQIVKTPIAAYGEWMSGLPNMISERFSNWERVFTGDYHSGSGSIFRGGSGGGGGYGGYGGGAVQQLKANEQAKRAARLGAMKTGGAMIAGASIAKLGSMLAYGGNQSHSEGDASMNDSLALEDSELDQLAETENSIEQSSDQETTTEDTMNATDAPVTDSLDDTDTPPVADSLEGTDTPPVTDSLDDTDTPPVADSLEGADAPPATDSLEGTGMPPVTDALEGTDTPPVTDSLEGEDKAHLDSETSAKDKTDAGEVRSTGESHSESGTLAQNVKEGKDTLAGKDESLSSAEPTPSADQQSAVDQQSSVEPLSSADSQVAGEPQSSIEPLSSAEQQSAGTLESTTLESTAESQHSLTSDTTSNGTAESQHSLTSDTTSNGTDESQHSFTSDTTSEGSTDFMSESQHSLSSDQSDRMMTGETIAAGGTLASEGLTASTMNPESDTKRSLSQEKSGIAQDPYSASSELSAQSPNRRMNERANEDPSQQRQSLRRKRLSKALGKGMMAMGGADPSQALKPGETRRMMGAGVLHATGGLVGAHNLTGKVAQHQIDRRNEAIVRNGGEIRNNLSTIGESRQQAQKRMENRIRTNEAMQSKTPQRPTNRPTQRPTNRPTQRPTNRFTQPSMRSNQPVNRSTQRFQSSTTRHTSTSSQSNQSSSSGSSSSSSSS